MAKRRKRVSGVDSTWMIFERMRDEVSPQRGLTVAVIPDAKLGWRAVLDGRSGKFLSPAAVRKFRSIENDLRSNYALARD
jgi:hypothetical protein